MAVREEVVLELDADAEVDVRVGVIVEEEKGE